MESVMNNKNPITSTKSVLGCTNKRSVHEFEQNILTHLRDATGPWIAIASLFSEANKELDATQFRELCENVRVSYSTARKLIKVATSRRLAAYSDRLATINSWSTLHEIVKLDKARFDEFAKEYLTGSEICSFKRSDVEKFKAPKRSSAKGEAYFTVRINSASSLSVAEKKMLDDAASSLEQGLAGKCQIKWHVKKPDTSSFPSGTVQ